MYVSYSFPDIIRRIYADDGLRGFYRGLGPTMVGYLPTWAIYFMVYDKGKNFFSSHLSTCTSHPGPDGSHNFLAHICSAMTAGVASTTCTSPLWVLQTSREPDDLRYNNILDAFRKIYRREGAAGFYKGLFPSLLGVCHVVVQFPLYEYFKSLGGRFTHLTPAKQEHTDKLSSHMILLCSGGSKMLASIATYPHEVLRTRLQMVPQTGAVHSHYRGFFQTIALIYRQEGFRGFYRGMGVNLVRTVPNSGLTILTYEIIMRHLGPLHGRT